MKQLGMMILLLGFVFSGCTTTQQGATAGGVGGAAIGGIIGHQSGHGVAGAAIGGAVGAVGGMIAGSQMEKKKFCPQCGRSFAGDTLYCPHDGTALKVKE